MAPPRFDPHGYLEAGIHRCTLEELEELFGWNACRRRLLAQLRKFVENELMQAAGQLPPLVPPVSGKMSPLSFVHPGA